MSNQFERARVAQPKSQWERDWQYSSYVDKPTNQMFVNSLASLDQPDRVNPPPSVEPKQERSIYGAVKENLANAYWLQRAARTRYPGADGVLNFTPYVGLATAADDIGQDLYQNKHISGENLAELALNRAAMSKYGKGVVGSFKNLGKYAEKAKDDTVARSHGRKTGHRGQGALLGSLGMPLALAASVPPVAYYQYYKGKQLEANEQYGDTPLRDIAKQLQANSK